MCFVTVDKSHRVSLVVHFKPFDIFTACYQPASCDVDKQVWAFCHISNHLVGCCLQEPQCRRRAVLAYFGEKHTRCHNHTEQLCDFCQDPMKLCKSTEQLEEALQNKAMAASAPSQTPEQANSSIDGAAQHSDEEEDQGLNPSCSSTSGKPEVKLSATVRDVGRAVFKRNVPSGAWRTAAAKRPAAAQPQPSDTHHSTAGAANADRSSFQHGAGSVTAPTSMAGDTAVVNPVKRRRFRVPFKVPRMVQ